MHQRPIGLHHCCPKRLMLITKQKDVLGDADIIIILPSECCLYPWAIVPWSMQHLLPSVHSGLTRLLLLIVLDNIQSSQSSNTTTIAISPRCVLMRSRVCHHSWLVSLKIVIMGAIAQTHSPRVVGWCARSYSARVVVTEMHAHTLGVVVANLHEHTQQELSWLTCTIILLELSWLTCTNILNKICRG